MHVSPTLASVSYSSQPFPAAPCSPAWKLVCGFLLREATDAPGQTRHHPAVWPVHRHPSAVRVQKSAQVGSSWLSEFSQGNEPCECDQHPRQAVGLEQERDPSAPQVHHRPDSRHHSLVLPGLMNFTYQSLQECAASATGFFP